MDKDHFVQNVKMACEKKGIAPTNACKEAGCGTSFLTDIKRGRNPGIEKFQMLASYLGVTVSDLLGEEKTAPIDGGLTEKERRLMELLPRLSEDQQALLLAQIELALKHQG